MQSPLNKVPNKLNKCLVRAGKYTFLFFLIKGIGWLVALSLAWELVE
jgi:hypothetical protein